MFLLNHRHITNHGQFQINHSLTDRRMKCIKHLHKEILLTLTLHQCK